MFVRAEGVLIGSRVFMAVVVGTVSFSTGLVAGLSVVSAFVVVGARVILVSVVLV